jgi:hypothetical protein
VKQLLDGVSPCKSRAVALAGAACDVMDQPGNGEWP